MSFSEGELIDYIFCKFLNFCTRDILVFWLLKSRNFKKLNCISIRSSLNVLSI